MAKLTKINLFACLLVLLSANVLAATSFSTVTIDGQLPENDITARTGYKVTYKIDKPGWYLLPSHFAKARKSDSYPTPTKENPKDSYTNYIDYRYSFSPFSKKYIYCEKVYNVPGVEDECGFEQIFNVRSEDMQRLSEEDLINNYMAYVLFSADWYYFSKPVKVSYDYHPYMLVQNGNEADDMGMLQSKLKEGWNLINYPVYLAYGHVKLGDCKFEKIYAFDDELQKWEGPEKEFPIDDELASAGLAVKVSEDCLFLARKEAPGPPTIPAFE
ncbi:hypothetical protein HYX00_05680 [Candidatus Woesearchaeota archaeon]|nr:hypothetical protein [Candidatus Woesearchaeota archaeon]